MRPKKSEDQPRLWKADETKSTVAEECIRHFCKEYLQIAQRIPGDTPLSEYADSISFVCLLICSEYHKILSPAIRGSVAKCREVASLRGPAGLYDHFPWSFALELMDKKLTGDSETLKEFIRNVDHPDSGVRMYLCLIGWIIRDWLHWKRLHPPLLENVAGTLRGWGMSAALCYATFDTAEEFEEYVDNHQLAETSYEEQYRERIEMIRGEGIDFFINQFYAEENIIRAIAVDYAMGLLCT